MIQGVNRSLPVVMDIDDKITAKEETNDIKGLVSVTCRSMKNTIGENSNYATVYHNKIARSEAINDKYMDYTNLISITTGKAVDYAKTGILFTLPKNITKYAKTLPYFMKYTKDYYTRKKLSRSKSNMNSLCWQLEKWEKTIRWKRNFKDFDYLIMLDPDLNVDQHIADEIEKIYFDFCAEMKQLSIDQKSIKSEYTGYEIDWNYYYQKYKTKCASICPNKKMLANIAVILCYEKYPNKNKKFIWRVASDGIISNLKQVPISLPVRNDKGNYVYLGKKYNMVPMNL